MFGSTKPKKKAAAESSSPPLLADLSQAAEKDQAAEKVDQTIDFVWRSASELPKKL